MTQVVRETIFVRISAERDRQAVKWGERSVEHDDPQRAVVVLLEEVGEVARAVLEDDPDGYARELVQVAAVAVAMLEAHAQAGSGALSDAPASDMLQCPICQGTGGVIDISGELLGCPACNGKGAIYAPRPAGGEPVENPPA